jgi:hypothetical protein
MRTLFVMHMSVIKLLEFWTMLGQSKFEDLTLFRDVNQEGADKVLGTEAHLNYSVEDGVYICFVTGSCVSK